MAEPVEAPVTGEAGPVGVPAMEEATRVEWEVARVVAPEVMAARRRRPGAQAVRRVRPARLVRRVPGVRRIH